MRESLRPDDEKIIVAQALMELAAATRDHTVDAGAIRVYMPHLDDYTADEVADACLQLERDSEWFPKVAELLKACSRARRRAQDAEAERVRASRPALPPMPPDPERMKAIMARLKATAYRHKMPSATVPSDE